MRQNFKARISYDGRTVQAIIIPEHRKDGIYYEVNIPGRPRFYMRWGATDKYEVLAQEEVELPDNLTLALSDAIEEKMNKN